MIYQTFIPISGYSLFACVFIPDNYKDIVLLLPGYSHSKSDMDFMLSDMRNMLVKNGSLVIQVDLYGHGDSCGDFFECDITTIKNNINGIVSWAKSEFGDKIKTFSRGIIGNILLEPEYSNIFFKKIILNPLFLHNSEIGQISKVLNYKKDIDLVDFNDYLFELDEESKYKLCTYLYALGAESRNIRGMKVKLSTLRSFLTLSTTYSNEISDHLFLITNSIKALETMSSIGNSKPLEFYENSFVRDTIWIEKIITKVEELFN